MACYGDSIIFLNTHKIKAVVVGSHFIISYYYEINNKYQSKI
jgi:hypothetical protein